MEIRCARKGTGGSNPFLSASYVILRCRPINRDGALTMARTELHGLLPLEEHAVRDALNLPFLGLCFCDDDGNVTMRTKSLQEIGVPVSRYDAASRLWSFQLDLHDDDMHNADTRPTEEFLKRLALIEGVGMLATREDWMNIPNWLMFANKGKVIARQITDHNDDDEGFARMETARSLVAALSWPAGTAFFEALQSRL